ncbi:MAG: Macrolide export ATP-binding/permease protein MacB [Myxococcales bacterium]|nr:Macrolide export ATP-binding/permease protein MacB [Myxococcales bacterium]
MNARVCARLLSNEALRSLARNKVRTGLATLAIAVGVATVIWVVGIGRAGKDKAVSELDKLGDNLIWLEAGSRNAAGVRTGSHGQTTLTAKDAEAIRRECPLVAKVSENTDGNLQAVYGGRNWSTHFRGVSPEYLDIKKWEVAEGAFFDGDQMDHFATVAVIGETVRRQLFGDDHAIGEKIRMRGHWFTVIGTLVAKGQGPTGQDQDDTVMLPWTTAMKRLNGKDVTWLDDILLSAVAPEAIPAATAQVEGLVRERHKIAAGADDDFNIRHPEEIVKAKIKSSETLEMLLMALASIALMVGGIGIMNVMFASVAQRTAEIGIRVAIGASPAAIQVQFLGEAVMLTLFGGGLGVLLSYAGAFLIEEKLGWQLSMAPQTSAGAVAFSVTVGVLFGFIPAHRAAQLDPIDALRNE